MKSSKYLLSNSGDLIDKVDSITNSPYPASSPELMQKVLKSRSALDLQNELIAQQRKARRSVQVTLINATNLCLKLTTTYLFHGTWTLSPPQFILPYSSVIFGTESPHRFINGHKGYVVYVAEDELRRECKFMFKWHNQILNWSAQTDWPEYYNIVYRWDKPGKHSAVTFHLRKQSFTAYTMDERLKTLHEYSYFNLKELQLLWDDFQAATASRGYLTKSDFVQLFPELSDELVLRSLFSAFARFSIRDENIDFEEYVMVLSIMARGSIEERIELSFNICDLNKNGFVSFEEVLRIVTAISRIMESLGFNQDFGNPEEIVNNIFAKSRSLEEELEEMTIAKGISKQMFLEQSQDDPDLAECFGMFPFLTSRLVVPIEKMINHKLVPQMKGYLLASKPNTFFINLLPIPKIKARYLTVREGLLAVYHRKEDEEPKVVVSLSSAIIKEGPRTKFYVSTPDWSKVFRCKSKLEKEHWVKVLRANVKGGYRFMASSPIRKNIHVKWLINGKEYFDALVSMILKAKDKIFIGGWYISPGLYLRRNPIVEELRLDRLLLRKAEEGVKIYVLIWAASQFAFNLQSAFVSEYFNALHKNIIACTHPNFTPLSWSHHQKLVVIDEEIAFIGGVDLGYNRYDDEEYRLSDPDGNHFPGRDYSNLAIIGESNGKPMESIVDRLRYPRMPWHDIIIQLTGMAAVDVSLNFMQRWNHVMRSNPANIKRTEYLFPKPIGPPTIRLTEKQLGYGNCNVQILRSIGMWSAGSMETERSIYKGYISAIKTAQHFIYIENQYFISAIERNVPKNKLLKALYQRLRIAIQHKQKFRVIIVLPVHPGGDPKDTTVRQIVKYTYLTINRGEDSILKRLRRDFPAVKISNYISFFALRNYETIGEEYQTEQVYVHAKMLIVDDRTVIIGSANINDRSLRGNRDSEIAAYIEPQDFIDSTMGGKPFKVSKFAQDLRMRLWRNYLGLDPDDNSIIDPVCDNVYKRIWRKTARANSTIYRYVFQVLPDNIRSESDFKKKEVTPPQHTHLLSYVRGFLVEFPGDFMENDELPALDKTTVLPKSLFL